MFVNKNGYVYIFTSNESQNVNVYFDNLQVSQVRGPLVEENHYYAFGLTMAGISSKAVGRMDNDFKFNDGTELNTEFDWNMYETPFRGYDAQVGRFHQVDPLVDDYSDWSPYCFAFNDPIGYNDPLGAYPEGVDPYRTMGYPGPGDRYDPETGASYDIWLRDQYAAAGQMDLYRQLYGYIPVYTTIDPNDYTNRSNAKANLDPYTLPYTKVNWIPNPLAKEDYGPGPKMGGVKTGVGPTLGPIPVSFKPPSIFDLPFLRNNPIVRAITIINNLQPNPNILEMLSVNQTDQKIKKGQAPKTISRLDKGKPEHNEKPHIHFTDGSALYKDGTWKHGGKILTNAEKAFLEKAGWVLP